MARRSGHPPTEVCPTPPRCGQRAAGPLHWGGCSPGRDAHRPMIVPSPSGGARNGGGGMVTRSSHRPERTCVGCRQVAPRADLVRLVRESAPGGAAPRVRVDPSGAAPGRPAWLDPAASWLERAPTLGGLPRTFRGPVDTGPLAQSLENPDYTRTWNR